MPALLTPDNRQIFLYRRSGYTEQIDAMIRESELVVRRQGRFDVYHSGNRLIYVENYGKHEAARFDVGDVPIVGGRFFVRLSPDVYRAGFTDRGPLAVGAWQRC